MNKYAQDLYDRAYESHGPTPGGLGWSSLYAQKTRFNELIECYYPPLTVLDAGCGYGDFSQYFTPEKYVGIDAKSEFIEEARRRYPTKRFVHQDVMDWQDSAEYVFACGLLAYQESPLRMLDHLWELTNRTLAFNWWRVPLRDLVLAIDRLSPVGYKISADYIPGDFTVFLHKVLDHGPPPVLQRPQLSTDIP